ncbi:MAG: RNA-directed DNA polymerase [Candidatus Sericytochromatia bacterium]|nr:RNA-directed DNA polymerase [Candidatus Sericytochromatia bacterium]
MKRHANLFVQITTFENLLKAARYAARGKRLKPRAARFLFDLEPELLRLQAALMDESWRPASYRLFKVYQPKPRQIAATDFADRVVHHAIFRILEPLLERSYSPDSYACRKGKGGHRALKQAHFFQQRYPFFLKLDIARYFDSVDHQVLKNMLTRRFKDPQLLRLLGLLVEHPVPGHAPGKGMPIGNLSSQHFANVYLTPLDYFVRHTLHCRAYVRYMDDFVLWSHSKETLWLWKAGIEDFLARQLKLQLKASASLIAPVTEGLPFLGFRVYPAMIRLSQTCRHRFRRTWRRAWTAYQKGKITEKAWQQSASSQLGHLRQANALAWRQKWFYAVSGRGSDRL